MYKWFDQRIPGYFYVKKNSLCSVHIDLTNVSFYFSSKQWEKIIDWCLCWRLEGLSWNSNTPEYDFTKYISFFSEMIPLVRENLIQPLSLFFVKSELQVFSLITNIKCNFTEILQKYQGHSVEIKELYFHTSLTKISWK